MTEPATVRAVMEAAPLGPQPPPVGPPSALQPAWAWGQARPRPERHEEECWN